MSEFPTYHSTWCSRGGCQIKTLTPVEEAYLESINALGKLAKRKGKQKGEQ